MKILVIGSGGREHAIAWKLAQSSTVTDVFVAPGNAGTGMEKKVTNIPLGVSDFEKLVSFAKENHVTYTFVGPEVPLAEGIVDFFTAHNLACLGPDKAAARLESSKAFSKAFMQRYGIPTAKATTFTDCAQAKQFIQKQEVPIVIKADGLAAGKGVVVAQTHAEAICAVENFMQEGALGSAGATVVIEECLYGEEVSFIVLLDGKHVVPLATSQDHKAVFDGDKGANTGGMGAYSPASLVTPALHTRIMDEVILPTIKGLKAEGCLYKGFLYAGLMLDKEGNPKVLEYNCRLGDPETQPILVRLQTDFALLCQAAVKGTLDKLQLEWDPRPALGVVLCAGGYPHSYQKGMEIHGYESTGNETTKLFQAGTVLKDGKLLTDGGRVLCVTALGDTLALAQATAYGRVKQIAWENMYYRTDIGYKEIAREQRMEACQT